MACFRSSLLFPSGVGFRTEVALTPVAGDIIGKYRVLEQMSQSATASVFRVEHVGQGSQHVLKLVPTKNDDDRERMFREARAQGLLTHENVVSVTDVPVYEGAPALIMELVEGPSLMDWIREEQPTLDTRLEAFEGILRGVGAAHEADLVHRALAPREIIVTRAEGRLVPKVLDFGMVKMMGARNVRLTDVGAALGSPGYTAPEQTRNASDVDNRADIFSLGCILYEMVCERSPFDAEAAFESVQRSMRGDYDPPHDHAPDLPEGLVELIDLMLKVKSHERLDNCGLALERLAVLRVKREAAAEGAEAVPVVPPPATAEPSEATPESGKPKKPLKPKRPKNADERKQRKSPAHPDDWDPEPTVTQQVTKSPGLFWFTISASGVALFFLGVLVGVGGTIAVQLLLSS